MSSNKIYDVVVIGGGPGGYVSAIRCAQLGLSVACVEKRKTLGGTCLNVGCIPSKALLDSSEHYLQAQNDLQKHGVEVKSVRLKLGQMMERKNEVVQKLTQGVASLLKKNKVDSVHGKASVQKHDGTFLINIEKQKESLQAKNVILATGSIPTELPFLPFDGKNVISSTEVLELQEVPQHLVIVGGGYIGLEMGSVWKRLGTKISVIEYMDTLLPLCDQELAKELHRSLKKQGLEFYLGTKCLGAKKTKAGMSVELENLKTKKKESLKCDAVLVCAGRSPYSEGLGLDELAVTKDARGFVQIDDNFQTNVPGLYAIGDLVPGPMLAHKAEEEGVAVAEHISGKSFSMNYSLIPSVIYTWPELSSVGYTEEELKEAGIPYKKGSFPFMANGRALAMNESTGKVKVLSHKESDLLLGVHIFGPRASDMIAEASAVMHMKGTAQDLAHICHAHPTLSEALKEAALATHKKALHM